MGQICQRYQVDHAYPVHRWVQNVLSLLAFHWVPWDLALPLDRLDLYHPWIRQLLFHLSVQLDLHDLCGPSIQEVQGSQEILLLLLILGIPSLPHFLVCLIPHLRLVFLEVLQVPFGQMDPCDLDHLLLQGVLAFQHDLVNRLDREGP